MTMSDLVKRVGKLTVDNSPSVMTAIGITGTVTTAFLTGKASFKAAEIIRAEEDDRRKQQELSELPVPEQWRLPLEPKEKVLLVWKEYIPAVSSAIVTVGCIVSANRIGARRVAALAAAYSISERTFTEYKEKVLEKMGASKEEALRTELAQERVNRHPLNESAVIVTSGGDQLCFESYTGRYFRSDMESLKKAVNDTNYRILQDDYVSLSDFYDRIGLDRTAISDEMGWNTENRLDVEFHGVLDSNGKPCIAIDYRVVPIKSYYF